MLNLGNHFRSASSRFPTPVVAAWLAFCTIAWGTVAHAARPKMLATFDKTTGRVDLMEGERVVLSYNYHTISLPEGLLEKVNANSKKYARPRSNYVHPLHGPDGEVLTEDWSQDHPHHRGIYWAWPEVNFKGELGDLHALQRVFARPTGKIDVRSGDGFAEVEAENVWKWENKTPIVREVAIIRAYPAQKNGRLIDLKLSFTAMEDSVSIARRRTKLYGGLNFRLSPVQGLEIIMHTDPEDEKPRRAWADSVGIRDGGSRSVGVAIFQKQTNPQYPGQWVEYPNLPWYQPTFPTAESRFVLKKDKPLVLEYRLWIRRGGKAEEADYDRQWRDYQAISSGDWKPLFNGKTLDGWHPVGDGKWTVEDGVIVGRANDEEFYGLLFSDSEYDNFTARFKFKVLAGDSGFYIRTIFKEPDQAHGNQVQVGLSGSGVGGVYESYGRGWLDKPDDALQKKIVKDGDWNEMVISAKDGDIVVHINGIKTADLQGDPARRKGHFALQMHSGNAMHVMFKDIEIRSDR